MTVTLLGIMTEVRPVQSWNAEFPMSVILVGMFIEGRLEQP